jgi:hypothetical protein
MENGKSENVIYEVNIKAINEIGDDFYTWLNGKHIEEMLKIDGFLSAKLLIPDTKDEGHRRFTVQYKLVSMEMMESYFKNQAAKMRSEGLEKFGDKFTAERRVLTVKNKFSKKNNI